MARVESAVERRTRVAAEERLISQATIERVPEGLTARAAAAAQERVIDAEAAVRARRPR